MKFTPADLEAKGYRLDTSGRWVKVNTRPEDDAATRPSAEHKTHSSAGWRVRKDRLNWVEREWFSVLQHRHADAIIIPQFRLRVGDFNQPSPVYFTADFAVWFSQARDYWRCVLWEVKDKRRKGHSDELVRPKMVHKNNPFVAQVMLAVWDGTTWEERQLS